MILQRNIMKKYTNKVRHTLRLGGSWNLVTLNSRVEEEGERGKKIFFLGGCPIREVFLRETLPHWPSIQIGNGRLQKFSHTLMRQLLLHSILLSYFTSPMRAISGMFIPIYTL